MPRWAASSSPRDIALSSHENMNEIKNPVKDATAKIKTGPIL